MQDTLKTGKRGKEVVLVQLLESRMLVAGSHRVSLRDGFVVQALPASDGFGFDVVTPEGTRSVFVCDSAIQQSKWVDALNSLDVIIGNLQATRLQHKVNGERDLAEAQVRQPNVASLEGMVMVQTPNNVPQILLAAFRIAEERGYIQRVRHAPGMSWRTRCV